MNKWIKFGDEEPPLDTLVLVYDLREGQTVAKYRFIDFVDTCDEKRKLVRVTHWMPLPHDPEKEKK